MSDLNGRYRLASQDIVHEEFDGEMVVLNLLSGHYFALNKSGSVLLNGLLQGHAPEALISVSSARISAEDASSFLRELVTHELLAADSSQSPTPLDATTFQAAQLLTEKPALEIHDDLADLIIADPIHESAETVGWPTQKAG